MMPKVTLRAIDGIGGTIHASKSGAAYEHDADGYVTVAHEDVVDLLATHERVPAERGQRAADAPQVTAVSVTSTTEGASALNPADRMKNTREVPNDAGQQNQDHGDATPPHGDPQNDGSTAASRAEAQAEVDAAKRAGIETEHRSALANTGHMGVAHANESDQAEARGEGEQAGENGSDAHDAAFDQFKDHGGQEDPTIRGKTKAELDEAGEKAGGA